MPTICRDHSHSRSPGRMSDELLTITDPSTFELGQRDLGQPLIELLGKRRSIRRLRPGPYSIETNARILEALRLTPSAFNLPSWHCVLIHAQRAAFWQTVEHGFRTRLEGDRLRRYLDRLEGFRNGVAVA